MAFIKGKIEDLGCEVFDKGKSNNSITNENCVNGTFFTYGNDDDGSRIFYSTSPLVVNGKAYRWASNHSKPQSCFIVYKDNRVEMKKINNINELDLNKVKFVFGGIGLVNKLDSNFKYDPSGEGFVGKFSDVLRDTQKTVIAYKKATNEIFLITEKCNHTNLVNKCRSYDIALSLDGGGSTFLRENGNYKVKGDGRLIHNIITLKKEVFPTKSIAIDAGHRNKTWDYGATNGNVKESELAMSIANKLKYQLEKNNIEVIMTRKDENQVIGLNERCELANKNNVDFYLSIHMNSADNKSANGIEVLHYEGTKNQQNAKKMCDEICRLTNGRNRGAKERNDLAVLKYTNMEALLVECGFISNEDECKKLQNDAYQDLIVEGIVVSLGYKYFKEKPNNEVLYRVCVGSYSNIENANKMIKELEGKGYKPFIAKYEKGDSR